MLIIQFFHNHCNDHCQYCLPADRMGTTCRLRLAKRLGAALPERASHGTHGGRRAGAGEQAVAGTPAAAEPGSSGCLWPLREPEP